MRGPRRACVVTNTRFEWFGRPTTTTCRIRHRCPEHHHRCAWQRAGGLLLEAAERNGSVDAVRRQVIFALLMDGKLDAGL